MGIETCRSGINERLHLISAADNLELLNLPLRRVDGPRWCQMFWYLPVQLTLFRRNHAVSMCKELPIQHIPHMDKPMLPNSWISAKLADHLAGPLIAL